MKKGSEIKAEVTTYLKKDGTIAFEKHDRKTKALLSLHDYGSREGATASNVTSSMLKEGFTLLEIREAIEEYSK